MAINSTYPFTDEVAVDIDLQSAAEVRLRVPCWADGATITVGASSQHAEACGFFPLQLLAGGSTVIVKFANSIRLHRWPDGAVEVHRGPLTYALRPKASVNETNIWGTIASRAVTTTGPWNYALDLSEDLRFEGGGRVPPGEPFSATESPAVRILAKARRVPQWSAGAGHGPQPPPPSPVETVEPLEEVELVPFGSTNVRISVFPVAKNLEPVPYTPGGSMIPAGNGDVVATKPATVTDNGGKDKGFMALRSGEPRQQSSAVLAVPFAGQGHRVAGARIAYRYVTGFNTDDGATGRGANFTISLSKDGGGSGSVAEVLYSSPELADHSAYTCSPKKSIECYSDPVVVEATDLDLSAEHSRYVRVDFENHDHTVQILLPFNVTILWHEDAVYVS